MKFKVLLPVAALAALLFCGCAVNNNYLTPSDFANHLVKSGVPVTQMQPLSPEPFRATEGLALLIDGTEVGVYKFNRDNEVQRRRIEKYEETGKAFIVGTPYPILVRGSFMLIGYEKNARKKEIIKAFESFE
ncbi:MAG: hypothetical protein AB7F32_03665 [Victivallaceae bacterium]